MTEQIPMLVSAQQYLDLIKARGDRLPAETFSEYVRRVPRPLK